MNSQRGSNAIGRQTHIGLPCQMRNAAGRRWGPSSIPIGRALLPPSVWQICGAPKPNCDKKHTQLFVLGTCGRKTPEGESLAMPALSSRSPPPLQLLHSIWVGTAHESLPSWPIWSAEAGENSDWKVGLKYGFQMKEISEAKLGFCPPHIQYQLCPLRIVSVLYFGLVLKYAFQAAMEAEVKETFASFVDNERVGLKLKKCVI